MKLTGDEITNRVVELHAQGMKPAAMAKALGAHRATVYRHIAKIAAAATVGATDETNKVVACKPMSPSDNATLRATVARDSDDATATEATDVIAMLRAQIAM